MSWRLGLWIAAVGVLAVALARLLQDDQTGTATWDAARASGFAGYLLLWASTASGLALHMRWRLAISGMPGLLELHRVSSVLAMAFVATHVFALLVDPVVHFAPWTAFVPMTSEYRPLQVSAGVVAQWTMVAVLASTALSPSLSWLAWRRVHYLSFPCYMLALLHGITSGTDSSQPLAVAIYAATASLLAAMTVARVVGRGWVAAGEESPLFEH